MTKSTQRAKMRPIFYRDDDCVEGPRIGGSVPKGLEGQIRDNHSQYFGTFPLPGHSKREFSVFHQFDIFGDDEDRDIIAHNNRILEPSDLVWAVVHPPSSRGELSSQAFEARALEIGTERADEVTDDDGNKILYPESKLGGKCFFERYWLREYAANLEKDGYEQLLQIGMHGSDMIHGFPWDPGYLHVWALNSNDPKTFRFMVEQ